MNTVLLTVDSLRPDHLEQYGYHRETFPALDTLLADGGDLYTAAYANGTHSAESIPSFLRSRYQPSLSEEEPSLAGVLSEAGVTTGAIHSNTVYDELVGAATADFDDYQFLADESVSAGEPPLRKQLFRGLADAVRPTVERLGVREPAERVQEWLFPSSMIHTVEEYTEAAAVTDAAIDWIEAVEEPFFLWVHYMDPHRPYGVSPGADSYGAPASNGEMIDLMSTAGISPEQITDDQRQRMRDWYDTDIRYTSRHVGRLVSFLDETHPDTGVVFTADHGDEFGEHGAYFHRNRPYDELIRVPLAARGPTTADRVVEEQRELVDLAATICRWHGVTPPGAFQGTPLSEAGERRVLATGSHLDQTPIQAGRWDGWKYIRAPTSELYNLETDPRETDDVATTHESVTRRYDRELTRQLEERSVAVTGEDADEAARDRLEQLGYLDDSVE